eukprot:CAMPEP_0204367404 /NCGR_PEP_ID=MMETSP0469-20131031/43396_1 /ASSEMBLY_ACC=CAM_ASM_000384 /TAXON_ID=2969 /ORGANISM="Oxyrrhis marina" /LENGTH=106 /DNA_ID=CAMNT_0051356785 /DNA_START=69 /DNA_END=386 /DNA_ORIENTATION=+
MKLSVVASAVVAVHGSENAKDGTCMLQLRGFKTKMDTDDDTPDPCSSCVAQFASAGGCAPLLAGDEEGLVAAMATSGIGPECEACEQSAFHACLGANGGSGDGLCA